MSGYYNKPSPPFMPSFTTVSIAATTNATVPTVAFSTTAPFSSVLITNEGTTTAMINFGTDNTVTASATVGFPVLGGTRMVVRMPLTSADAPTQKYSTAAAAMISGTATIRFSNGDGGA